MNPSHDLDTNLSNNKKRIKQRIYDWLYDIKKLIDDSEKSKTIEVHPKFRGSKRLLMKLPEWIRPMVTYFSEKQGTVDSYNYWPYRVYADPLPDDPNQEEVMFESDTLTELKDDIQAYKESFARWGYDY